MKMQPYLTFNGTAEEAFLFYEKALGGKIIMLSRYSDLPADDAMAANTPGPDVDQKIMHIRLQVGEQVLMASDCHPSQPYTGIHGASIALGFDTVDEGHRAFAALADGAAVHMPFGPTFWAEGFGMLVDRFGVPWMVNAAEKTTPPDPM